VNAALPSGEAGWRAEFDLRIERAAHGVQLGRREHVGPLRVQRPFFPEGRELVHVYLLHPPGGLVGGDRLLIRVAVGPKAAGLVTTPAAQKIYRSAGQTSSQRVELSVGAGGSLEWLPTESIVFDGARIRQCTRVELAHGASFMGWELGGFGRPASGLGFSHGELAQNFELWRAGVPLLIDQLIIPGGSELLDAPYGYAGMRAYGTFYAVPSDPALAVRLVEVLRAELPFSQDPAIAITSLDGVVVVRALASGLTLIRPKLQRAWELLRPELLGRPPCAPRIWAT